ncbi:hypothetical protein M2271_002491 [Streptomyces sp. LBL]|nr:hypothetical protein [Streptomyces sp. LBL]
MRLPDSSGEDESATRRWADVHEAMSGLPGTRHPGEEVVKPARTTSATPEPSDGPVRGLSAWRFVLVFGGVSLLMDFVYEGARSVTGPLLAHLGASSGSTGRTAVDTACPARSAAMSALAVSGGAS